MKDYIVWYNVTRYGRTRVYVNFSRQSVTVCAWNYTRVKLCVRQTNDIEGKRERKNVCLYMRHSKKERKKMKERERERMREREIEKKCERVSKKKETHTRKVKKKSVRWTDVIRRWSNDASYNKKGTTGNNLLVPFLPFLLPVPRECPLVTKDKKKGLKIGLTSRPQLKLARLLYPFLLQQLEPHLARWKKKVVIFALVLVASLLWQITKRRREKRLRWWWW